MKTCVHISIAVVSLIFIAQSGALAQSPSAPDAPLAQPQPPAVASPDAPNQPKIAPMPGQHGKAKGDPGMLGNPWPKTPEEADKTIANLLAHLATSDDALTAGSIAASIEKLWRLPGGDTVNLLMDRAENETSKMNTELGLKLLDAAVELAPDYAEVWNRRAYVFYRIGNMQAALGDLRRTLALEPNHFRALDGMAKILDNLGEKKAALKAYDQLLAIHPQIEGAQEAADELRKTLEGQGI
jgi:tetratricopeptide (TPR) repeat protein